MIRALSRLAALNLVLVAGASVSACVHTSARTVSDTPPLAVPLPPPRIVETIEASPLEPVPLIEEPARQPVLPPTRQAPSRAESTKPDPKSEPASEPPKVVEEPVKPPPILQTTPAAAEAEVERRIVSVITRAKVALARVDSRALNVDARDQFDTATRFIRQAEAELRTTRNLVFAESLADKAAGLAAQLPGR